jgi:exopolysaccharide biosynthesis polyprenyl glycosylphosphotransferase
MSIIEAQLGGSIGFNAQPFQAGLDGARFHRQAAAATRAILPDRFRLRGLFTLVVIDAAASIAAPRAALTLIHHGVPAASKPLICAILFLATLTLMALGGTYRVRVARAPLDHLARLLGILAAVHLLVLGQLWLAAPEQPPALSWAALVFGLALALTIGGRVGLAIYWRQARSTSPCGRAVLIAATPCSTFLARTLDIATGHAIGFALNWENEAGLPAVLPWRGIDGLATLEALIADGAINEILLLHRRNADDAAQARISALLARLADKPVRVRLAVDLSAEIDAFGFAAGKTMRLVPLLDMPLSNAARAYKRALDIIIGSLMVMAAAPLMALIALALWRSGPILFRQRRIGANGQKFTVLKFRTMFPQTVQAPLAQVTLAQVMLAQAKRGDPRVTRLGAWLRRTSLDELPQLFNVLRGEMSLVGPRPHAPGTSVGTMPFETVIGLYGVRHRLKPGMTGLAQIRGQRGGTEHPDALTARIASDFEYVENWSPGLDFTILLRTIPQVVAGRNAY